MDTIKDKSILLVDDEPAILLMCQSILKENGFTNILTADTALRALERLSTRPDLAVLDVMLPDMDGFMLAKVIRKQTNIPILFLTAKGEFDDKARGFEAGADDYIVKPFDLDELGARIAAHLRREQRRQGNAAVRFFGNLSIDYSARIVHLDGENISFSKREFDIIELLSMNAGQVFDRERIYELVWGLDGGGSSDTIMEHIRKIRAKLSGASPGSYIETVWGVGYKWVG